MTRRGAMTTVCFEELVSVTKFMINLERPRRFPGLLSSQGGSSLYNLGEYTTYFLREGLMLPPLSTYLHQPQVPLQGPWPLRQAVTPSHLLSSPPPPPPRGALPLFYSCNRTFPKATLSRKCQETGPPYPGPQSPLSCRPLPPYWILGGI